MDIEIAKIVTAVVGIIGAPKVINELIHAGKHKLREEYKFAKDFIDETKKDEKMHPFLLEKGYQAIAGTSRVKTEDIEYILALKDPVNALRDFVFCKRYLILEEKFTGNRIGFKKKYCHKFSRSLRRFFYYLLYVLMGSLAISPVMFPTFLNIEKSNVILALLIMFPFFGFYAYIFVTEAIKIGIAEKLVATQEKHKKQVTF